MMREITRDLWGRGMCVVVRSVGRLRVFVFPSAESAQSFAQSPGDYRVLAVR